MRQQVLVHLHRWFGLFIAVFLFIAGATGAIISWDHELDEWLNPHLFNADAVGEPQSALLLANKLEAEFPQAQVTYLPVSTEPGHALVIFVSPRVNQATGDLYELDFNQVAVDPVSGEIKGKRMWGEAGLTRESLLPFLYKLHYSMHIPEAFGIELGMLIMGIVGIIWALDCFIALAISFPKFSSWRKSFAFRWQQGNSKLNFDLHRSGGVWVWLFLLLIAITSISMNLEHQVMRPVISSFADLTPHPISLVQMHEPTEVYAPGIDRRGILAIAKKHAVEKGLSAPAGAIFFSPEFRAYGVSFYAAGQVHPDGLGNPWLYYSAENGDLVGSDVPGTGTVADIFMQAQFPIHSGRILGLPGRVLMSVMGLVVAMLSLTGIIIWLRKRVAKVKREKAQGSVSSELGGGILSQPDAV